jgi:hypothetical protein
LLFSSVGICGCSSSDSGGGSGGSSGGGAGGSGGTVSTGGSGGSGGAGGSGGSTSCSEGPGFPSSAPQQPVAELTATILDLGGAPAANVGVQLCGLDLCINGSTTDQGVVCSDKGTGFCTPGLTSTDSFKLPAFKYGDGIGFVKFAQLLPAGTTKHNVGTVMTAKLPDVAQGVALTPGGSATSSGVVLTLAAGAKITIDELTFDTPELQKFRAAEVPIAKAPPAVDKSAGFEIIVGTTPINTELCPHGGLSVPNTAGWAADTEVEFWLHGVEASEDKLWAPYGGWAKVSGGKVSSDGKSVVTHDGEGVPVLGVFGIKKK